MRLSKILVFLATADLVAPLSACATVPETGRSQQVLISPDQEARMGFKVFSEMKGKAPEFLSRPPWTTPELRSLSA